MKKKKTMYDDDDGDDDDCNDYDNDGKMNAYLREI